ncbi:MAG: hypothetical protein K2L12_02940 [Clostridia bacterium]|nr:hypothetical protein [Clostridia bacterium]
MNFTAYIERQKRLIRNRHEGETFLIHNGETLPLNESEKLFSDLNSLKGLNTLERLKMSKVI